MRNFKEVIKDQIRILVLAAKDMKDEVIRKRLIHHIMVMRRILKGKKSKVSPKKIKKPLKG